MLMWVSRSCIADRNKSDRGLADEIPMFAPSRARIPAAAATRNWQRMCMRTIKLTGSPVKSTKDTKRIEKSGAGRAELTWPVQNQPWTECNEGFQDEIYAMHPPSAEPDRISGEVVGGQ